MRALVIEKPFSVVVKDIPIPKIKDDELLIKVNCCGVCGTDVHIFKGEYLGSYPIIPGHEFSGIVERVGSKVSRFQVGDHVVVEPNISCDNCNACLNNRQNFCEHWNGVGVTLPGGMAEYAVAPEKAVFSIGSISLEEGAFVEPLSCVLHGIERTHIELADNVLILGAGPIGMLLCQMVRIQGAATITQVDRNLARLEVVRGLGASRIESSLEAIPTDYYDVVIDASGSTFLMEESIKFVRKGGVVLLFGVPQKDATLRLPAFTIFEKGLTFLSSYTSVRNSIQAIRLLESRSIDVHRLISHRLKLEEFEKAVEILDKGSEHVLKVMMVP